MKNFGVDNMKFFFDTYALIEMIEGNPGYDKYLDSNGVTLSGNVAELFWFFLKKHDEKTARYFHERFSRLIVDFPSDLIAESMTFRYKHKKKQFSPFDCFGYSYAQANNRIFVTGDRAFKGLKNVEIVR